MLVELKISGFAVIDRMEIHFLRPGMNVLTGETGAGKSILVKSLSLLLGGKASADAVRSGYEQAVVEGAFDLSLRPDVKASLREAGYAEDQEDLLVVRRLISKQGKHRIYINGHMATINTLDDIMARLVEITGQHEHQSLLKPSSQLLILDRYAELEKSRDDYEAAFEKLKDLRAEVEALAEQDRDRASKLEYLNFQIQEIESFNPSASDESDLVAKFQRARYAAKIQEYVQRADALIDSGDESVLSKLGDLVREGETLASLDSHIKNIVEELKTSRIRLEETAFKIRDCLHQEDDDSNSEQVEERLSQWRKIQKKYGQSVNEVLAFLEQARTERDRLENFDKNLEGLKAQSEKLSQECLKKARELHKKRVVAGEKLSAAVNKELKDLNMKGVEFSALLTELADLYSSGLTGLQFVISNSAKDEPRPLHKVASGGELSRIMLAIKQKLVDQERPLTYFFDEVDAGISGPTAEKVGRKIKNLGRVHQAVCITHLPQVAAFADAHFLISKEVTKGQVFHTVAELSQKDRVKELGRLISGEKITSTSLAHAKELLQIHK